MHELGFTELALRLLAAFGAGVVVGWERESRGRPAGLRTTILASLAAAMAMIISEALYIASDTSGSWRPDPARLGAGILTGIGFLGAGTILRFENFIRGVTTAASLWTVTVLGLAFGSGLFVVGALGLLLTAITLLFLTKVERFIPVDFYATLELTLAPSGPDECTILDLLKSRGVKVLSMKMTWDAQANCRSLKLELKYKRPQRFSLCSEIVTAFAQMEGVRRVDWE